MRKTVPLLLLSLLTVTAAAVPRAEKTLSLTWSVKPAVSYEPLPSSDSDWGSFTDRKWPWGVDSKKTGWNKIDQKKINRVWYKQNVEVPADWKNSRVTLDFERIDGDGIVFVNGKRIGEILNPAAEIELSNLKFGGQNEILVYMTRDYHGISRPFKQDYMNYAARGPQGRNLPMERWPLGITAPVHLKAMPRGLFLKNVRVVTSVKKKEISFLVEAVSGSARNAGADVGILDADGRAVLSFREEISFKKGMNSFTLSSKWENPKLWELEKSSLYTAEVSLKDGGRTMDRFKPFAFGFREFEVSGNKILLNGHPIRFRLACNVSDELRLNLVQAIGFNTIEFQPNSTAFYCDWNTWLRYDPAYLDLLDRRGILYMLPTPSVSNARALFLESPEMRAEYERQIKLWLDRYGNRPGLIAWIPSMNFTGSHSNIHADGMGRRDKLGTSAAIAIVGKALDVIRKHDPTRLAFAHGDGAIGDIASSNMYLNFVPLQEREEWPSDWAKNNEMPYMAVEFGQPCTINYWKGPRFLLTEYMAMYLGEKAYTDEAAGALPKIVNLPYKNMYTNWFALDMNHYPAFYDFEGLFMRNTNRAWRTWGVTGWYNWDFDIAYGMPEGTKIKVFNPYANLKENVTSRPSWATPRWDYIAETTGPLLAYIAGFPKHTDKTHAFYSGETVKKNVAIVWDGPGTKTFHLKWSALAGGKQIAEGAKEVTLTAGAIRLEPFAFQLPDCGKRTDGVIQLTLTGGKEPVRDRFAIQIFPLKTAPPELPVMRLFDPAGKSAAWLDRLGIKYETVDSNAKPDLSKPLIMGRESLAKLAKLPFTAEDVKNGLRVLFLEQQPSDWELMGFKVIETMPRYVFPRSFAEPLFAGMEQADFINWRGTPDLLPEKKWARSYDFYHAPKWTNTHAVASVVFETPTVVGFEPLIKCEFDLKYSPLLRARYGKGAVYYSSMELTANAGADPAAAEFARRLLAETARKTAPAKEAATTGLDKAQENLISALQVGTVKNAVPGNTVNIAGRNADYGKLRNLARKGETVLFLPSDGKLLAAAGFGVEKRSVCKLAPERKGIMKNVSQDLLRWRDKLEILAVGSAGKNVALLAEGTIAVEKTGKGELVFCQLDPFQLMTRYDKTSDKGKTVWPSVEKGFALYSVLLNNLGVGIGPAVAERLVTLRRGITYSSLNGWNVCGPFFFPGLKHDRLIRQKTEAEEDAIAGRAYPDTVYYLRDGRQLNWRRTVSANDSGYIDLQKELNTDKLAMAYLTRKIECAEARNATIRLGMDFYLEVWLNGTLVFDARKGGGQAPKPNTHRFIVHLKKGVNILTVKVSSGSAGFGLYANMSNEAEKSETAAEAEKKINFYPEKDNSYDPYQFGYY